jgi:hypothetical protein
LGPV